MFTHNTEINSSYPLPTALRHAPPARFPQDAVSPPQPDVRGLFPASPSPTSLSPNHRVRAPDAQSSGAGAEYSATSVLTEVEEPIVIAAAPAEYEEAVVSPPAVDEAITTLVPAEEAGGEAAPAEDEPEELAADEVLVQVDTQSSQGDAPYGGMVKCPNCGNIWDGNAQCMCG